MNNLSIFVSSVTLSKVMYMVFYKFQFLNYTSKSLRTTEMNLNVRANAGKKYLLITYSFMPTYAHTLHNFYYLQWYYIVTKLFSILIVCFCIHFSPLSLIVLFIIVRYYLLAFFIVSSRIHRVFLVVSTVINKCIVYKQHIQFVTVLDVFCFVYLIVAVIMIILFLFLCTHKNVWT